MSSKPRVNNVIFTKSSHLEAFNTLMKGNYFMPKGVPVDHSYKHTILRRLHIARGQLDSVIQMVETDAYCMDVILQNTAVEAALKHTDRVILKNHLTTCVSDAIHEGRNKDVIYEIIKIFDASTP